jgi:hypothetical protein
MVRIHKTGRNYTVPMFHGQSCGIAYSASGWNSDNNGTHEKYQANMIAENMFAQVDSEGNQFLLLQEITDHKKDHSAVPI